MLSIDVDQPKLLAETRRTMSPLRVKVGLGLGPSHVRLFCDLNRLVVIHHFGMSGQPTSMTTLVHAVQ